MKVLKVILCLISVFVLSGCESKKDYSKVDKITKDVMDVSKKTTARDDSVIKSDYTYVVSIRCDGNFDNVTNNIDALYGEYDEELNLARLYFKSKSRCEIINPDQGYEYIPSLYAYYNVYGFKEKFDIPDKLFKEYVNKDNYQGWINIDITKDQKDEIEKYLKSTYDQILKDLSLEDDEDLIDYFDWIIDNQDISNKKIEH